MRHLGEARLSQRAAFWSGEGDQWHQRNLGSVPDNGVLWALKQAELPHTPTIVEIGCGEGNYIGALQQSFGAVATGLDVSEAAIKAAKKLHPQVNFVRNSAHAIVRYEADMILFGFCLYLIDRDDLFSLVAGADRALNSGGYLAIHDFDPPHPHAVPYHHKEGLFSYKMDYSKLWLANPTYELFSKTVTRPGEALTIIRKEPWNRWQTTI